MDSTARSRLEKLETHKSALDDLNKAVTDAQDGAKTAFLKQQHAQNLVTKRKDNKNTPSQKKPS